LLVGGCSRPAQRLDPEAARARGDAMLRAMSQNMAATPTFSFTADEQREVAAGDGKKAVRHSTRQVSVQRPDKLVFSGKGDRAGEVTGWYDGKQLTLVSHDHKVWARGPMPGTLDESLDFLAAEYRLHMPTADLLYSSPYDALMTKETTGGWVDVQKVGELSCDHLAYQQPEVDWEIWIDDSRHLPCQMKITYKNEPNKPTTTVTYHALGPRVDEAALTPKVPEGYQRIKIMRHATRAEPADATPRPTATSGSEKNNPR
jgi:hypothetical protein